MSAVGAIFATVGGSVGLAVLTAVVASVVWADLIGNFRGQSQ
jgi:hypothetical protein